MARAQSDRDAAHGVGGKLSDTIAMQVAHDARRLIRGEPLQSVVDVTRGY